MEEKNEVIFFENLFSSVSKISFAKKRFIKGNNEIEIVCEICYEL